VLAVLCHNLHHWTTPEKRESWGARWQRPPSDGSKMDRITRCGNINLGSGVRKFGGSLSTLERNCNLH